MKKVLSVLLAAAMVMGMSVTSMADRTWNAGATGAVDTPVSTTICFDAQVIVVSTDGTSRTVAANSALVLEPGDDLYFPIMNNPYGTGNYVGNIDPTWSINIKGDEYVDEASYYSVPAYNTTAGAVQAKTPWGQTVDTTIENRKYVKVDIVKEYEDVDSTTTKFQMYIADGQVANSVTEKVVVAAKLGNDIDAQIVSYNWTNDADRYSKWTAPEGKAGTAVFDFDGIFFTVKMVSEEKVYLNLSQKYDKDIDAEYNEYDADLSFYNFKGDDDYFTKTGELLIPSSKDNKFIYEVVDGELVAVEAEWTDSYKVANVNKKVKGYVIETKELGYYVVADEELVIAEEEVEVEAPVVEDNKANPETGANDFVGAAVALAVVSVAAAGALALKK